MSAARDFAEPENRTSQPGMVAVWAVWSNSNQPTSATARHHAASPPHAVASRSGVARAVPSALLRENHPHSATIRQQATSGATAATSTSSRISGFCASPISTGIHSRDINPPLLQIDQKSNTIPPATAEGGSRAYRAGGNYQRPAVPIVGMG